MLLSSLRDNSIIAFILRKSLWLPQFFILRSVLGA
ncbi:hypothetical protein EVA_16607 [gut metagenome]|uniref:Uncharacterized protein n=1 Tax=gut metagenome TaxID=749906 RepID=J9FK53_9ZZZZ